MQLFLQCVQSRFKQTIYLEMVKHIHATCVKVQPGDRQIGKQEALDSAVDHIMRLRLQQQPQTLTALAQCGLLETPAAYKQRMLGKKVNKGYFVAGKALSQDK